MTLHSMFSVPILHYNIDDWETNKKRILDCLPDLDDTHLESNGEVYTDFFHKERTDPLPPYADVVIDIITPYLREFTNGMKIEFTDMWFQSAYRGNKHGIHNHGHSGWSSVIYLEYDPEVHTATTFYSPFLNPWSGRLESFCPPVKEGDMIIFPSTIGHEAKENTSDIRRSIISYNMRGKVCTVRRTLFDEEVES
jgi:hypothetical protein